MRLLATMVVCWAALCGTARGDDPDPEVGRLQGTWKPVRLERRGEPAQDAFAPAARVVVKGNVLRFHAGDAVVQELRFAVGPARSPRAIDLVSLSGPTKGRTLRGIYRLDGRRLTLCWSVADDGKRPTAFGPETAGDVVTFTLERETTAVVQSRGSVTLTGLRQTVQSGCSARR